MKEERNNALPSSKDSGEKEYKVGDKISFRGEKQRFTIQAKDNRFLICTKPLNMIRRLGGGKYEHTKTVIYTIVDFKQNRRGPENLIFGFGAETKEECEEMLKRLNDKDDPTEVSYRYDVPLDITL